MYYGFRRVRQLGGRVCFAWLSRAVGCFEVAAVAKRTMGRERSYNLGSLYGRSHRNEAILPPQRLANPRAKHLSANSIADPRQRVYQPEADGNRGGLSIHEDTIAADESHLPASWVFDRAARQFQAVGAGAGARRGEDQVSRHAARIQGGLLCQLQPF